MNQPPESDPAEVARRQARLEQQMMEAKLEIYRTSREQRESTVKRRLNFFLVFALSVSVAYVLDHKGYSAQTSILGFVLSIVVLGGWWAFRA
jgi:VanZ family protein